MFGKFYIVRGVGNVLETTRDKGRVESAKENPFSSVHSTRIGARIEIFFRNKFDTTRDIDFRRSSEREK